MTDKNDDTTPIDDLLSDMHDTDEAMKVFEALDDAGQATAQASEKARTYALVTIARALTISVLICGDEEEEGEVADD